MKIVVLGASGLIGSKLVDCLYRDGHAVAGVSPCSGLDTVSGEGLVEAVTGADIVFDLTNSRSAEPRAAMDFFGISTRNIMEACRAAEIEHHVVMSYVGADRLRSTGYMCAKIVQEEIVRAAGVPYTIVRSTQGFESVERLARPEAQDEVRLPAVRIQPAASEDIAALLGDIARMAPLNGTLEIAGPERFSLPELARQVLSAREDPRRVFVDRKAPCFGCPEGEESLLPGPDARLMPTSFSDWLRQSISPD